MSLALVVSGASILSGESDRRYDASQFEWSVETSLEVVAVAEPHRFWPFRASALTEQA